MYPITIRYAGSNDGNEPTNDILTLKGELPFVPWPGLTISAESPGLPSASIMLEHQPRTSSQAEMYRLGEYTMSPSSGRFEFDASFEDSPHCLPNSIVMQVFTACGWLVEEGE